MAREEATYEKVKETYQSLVDEGQKPTIRMIRNLIGGSNTTISKHIQTLTAQRRKEKLLNYSISEKLRDTLIDEMLVVADTTRETMIKDITALAQREDEHLKIMSDLECQLKEQREKENDMQQHITDLESTFAKEQIEMKRDIEILTDQLNEARDEIKNLNKTISEKNVVLGKQELTLKHEQEMSLNLQKQNNQLAEELSSLQKQHSKTEQNLAAEREKSNSIRQLLEANKARTSEIKEEVSELRYLLGYGKNKEETSSTTSQ